MGERHHVLACIIASSAWHKRLNDCQRQVCHQGGDAACSHKLLWAILLKTERKIVTSGPVIIGQGRGVYPSWVWESNLEHCSKWGRGLTDWSREYNLLRLDHQIGWAKSVVCSLCRMWGRVNLQPIVGGEGQLDAPGGGSPTLICVLASSGKSVLIRSASCNVQERASNDCQLGLVGYAMVNWLLQIRLTFQTICHTTCFFQSIVGSNNLL